MKEIFSSVFVLAIGLCCLFVLGPCSKPAPKWTDYGDGSFGSYQQEKQDKKDLENALIISGMDK